MPINRVWISSLSLSIKKVEIFLEKNLSTSSDENTTYTEMEVDTEERDLEKLVFGDNAGFNTGISGLAQSTRQKFANFDLEPGNQELVALDAGLEDLDDDDVRRDYYLVNLHH